MEPLQAVDPEYVGRYRLLGRLGEGGMGRVYLGRTPEGQQAAVKVIRDDLAGDTGFRHRFRREVSAAVAVAGMFTARVLDADPDADPPWLATQFVEGPSLRDMVLRNGPLDEPSLRRLAQGLAEALSAIHAAGLVHRDLKPANVLLAADGARVIDFGIAHTSGSTQLTGTGEMIGTPEYMSPEQVSGTGPPGPASDVFAMGATLCFAATGRGPFAAGHTAAVLYRILESEPDLRGMPKGAADVAVACLAKDP
ncbi:MAG: serine/threonine protein kinase, partial [Pseudonocardia sp.]|nr:serine/threonine protein kinase [Pseudonocardia sp.]